MRVFISLILCVFLFNLSTEIVFSVSAYAGIISKMEKSLLGIEYQNQSDIKRLERLEIEVYGTVSNSNLATRVNNLKKSLNADLIGQEITPKEDTFAEEEDKYIENIPKADNSVTYPIIDEMEMKVFQKQFPQQDVSTRIQNLEKKVFNKNYIQEDLNKRTERLKASVLKKEASMNDYDNIFSENFPSSDNFYAPKQNNSSQSQMSDNFFGPQNNMYNSQKYEQNNTEKNEGAELGKIEKTLFKSTYNNDPMNYRLARIEQGLFGITFESDDDNTRIQRITSAFNAKKNSAKYDSNKFQKHMSTIVQIGTIVLIILAMVL